MKNFYKFRHTFTVIFVICLILTILCFVQDYGRIFKYILLFIDGAGLALSFTFFYGDKSVKQLDFLERKMKLWNNISFRVKKAGENAFNNLPVGIIVFDSKKKVEWANSYAKDIFMSSFVERNLYQISDELASQIDNNNDFTITLYGKIYEVKVLKDYNVIYLLDNTDYCNLQKRYSDRLLSLGILNIDNLDQALSTYDAQEKSSQMSNIIGILSDWADDHQIYLKGLSEEKYLLIMDQSQLTSAISDNFLVIDNLKDYCSKEGIRVSVSIGIACEDVPAVELIDKAEDQLEKALNRGGDQCVVLYKNNTSFYGAKNVSNEQRSPVDVKIRRDELVDVIQKSSNVLIMGHKASDTDSFGACIGLYRLCQAVGMESKIVFDYDKADATVKAIYYSIVEGHRNLLDHFESSKEALKHIDKNTLLIVVDCHSTNLVMEEKLLAKCSRVAIIDHHRLLEKAISNAEFFYIQTKASSSVELVTGMLSFIDEDDLELTDYEATLMVAGIVVDTNNLVYRTSDETFNVLSKLHRYEADMNKVRSFLRENSDDYQERISMLNRIEFINEGFGLVVCDENKKYERQFFAKIADNMITIKGIKAAFCMGYLDKNVVGISARSYEECNVQLIMEKLGGGGHFSTAAAQLADTTLDQAKEKLLNVLKEMKNYTMSSTTTMKDGMEEAEMKVILLKDLKKDKKDDIIEVKNGYAYDLIRKGIAVEATNDNIKDLEKKQRKEEEDKEKLIEEMKELKQKIDGLTVTTKLKVGKNGKMFGSISKKKIIEEYKAQNHIDLSKFEIKYEKNIEGLGTYKIPVKLHKEVTATIVLYVVEEK